MKPGRDSPAAGQQHKAHPVPVRELLLSQAVAGHEALVVHHHLNACIQRPFAVEQNAAHLGPAALKHPIEEIGKAAALQLDFNPPADRGGEGRKTDGLNDDFHRFPPARLPAPF